MANGFENNQSKSMPCFRVVTSPDGTSGYLYQIDLDVFLKSVDDQRGRLTK